MNRLDRPLSSILKELADVAKELGYSKETIRKIMMSKSEIEAENYMTAARHKE